MGDDQGQRRAGGNRHHLRGVPQEATAGETGRNPTIDALVDLARQRAAHDERAAVVSKDPLGEKADRFNVWKGEALEQETRNVRLDLSFGDPISIRDQAEMIIGIMNDVIAKTREHHLGEINQRIEARRVADYGRRQLARFNGKTPHGDTYRKR